MPMDRRIIWCMRQKRGISLTDPKPHLSESYMKEADETLENMLRTTGKWKLITAYYACYNALYSLLMRAGIRSEIHDCTIRLMGLFGFTREEAEFMADLKDRRIQTQYYLKSLELEDEAGVKRFVARCKAILEGLGSHRTDEIREGGRVWVYECI